jgi:hypothetical protein
MEQNTVVDAMRQLLEQTRMAPDQMASRLEQAGSAAYWERLNPTLSVCRNRSSRIGETHPIGPRRREALVKQFAADGYFQLDPLLPGATVRRMRRGIEILKKADWPPIFAFVYDEFWQVMRVPSLVQLLSAVLGDGYRHIPHGWLFYIPARPGAAGWPPHTDGPGPDRPDYRNRLSVWIPLSDATLDNGCMYVIPRRRIEARIEALGMRQPGYTGPDVRALLQASRALPARAGSILGWNFDLIHWGSVCGDARAPRVSISVEIIGGDAQPNADELPLLDPKTVLPTLAQRLDMIARAIRDYQRFEPLMVRYHDLAQRLAESFNLSV